uniref:Si:ch211-157p22.10 n=1 Tax=Salarias fasciatus TaxID=181472 RepID=A0A672F312_SALFA
MRLSGGSSWSWPLSGEARLFTSSCHTEACVCVRACVCVCVYSILGSGSIIYCLMLQRLSRTPELQPLFLLSVSDLLLAFCWLIGVVLFSRNCSSVSVHCYNLHTVEQVLYMASFFCTLNYVWNLYKGLREKLYSCLSGYSCVYVCVCVLLPLLLMTPVFIWGNISECHTNFSQPYRCLLMHTGPVFNPSHHQPLIPSCSLLRTYHRGVFLSSFILTLLVITVFVVKSRRIYRRVVTSQGYLGNQQRALFRLMDRRMILYPLIFIICWGPAVTLAFMRVVLPSAVHGFLGVILYVSQAFTSASQGFLNSLVYGWTRVQLRRSGHGCRDADTQTPLLRAQKDSRTYRTLRSIC